MKIVIADDEEKICQLIYKLVDWDEMDMRVICIAHNGIEAMDAITKYQPDIVITDIRMPGCDGLEMIKSAKDLSEYTEFIIISGYRHFEYAQSAIKYGVRDYLLKPINKLELIASLTRIKKSYLERTKRLSFEEQNRITIQNSLDKLRNAFFSEILLKRIISREEMNVEYINKEYHFSFQQGCFQLVLIKIDGLDISLQDNISYIQEKIVQSIRKHLLQECFELENYFEGNICMTVLNYAPNNKKKIRKILKNVLNEILLQKEVLENFMIAMGVGLVQENMKDLNHSFKTAMWAIEQRLIIGTDKLIEGEENSLNEVANSSTFYEFNKRLTEGLIRLDEQMLMDSFVYLQEVLKNKEDITGHEVIQMSKEAINLYMFTMRQNHFQVKDSENFFEKCSYNIENIATMEGVFSYLIQTIMNSYQQAIEDKRQEANKPVREVKQYIQKHFMDAVSLEIVSDYVGFNATYFSSLFKKETGSTFLEYLIDVRMTKAKEMLRETNWNVATICEEVGYNDIKHFTKSFYKYTNLKPNEYRKIYS